MSDTEKPVSGASHNQHVTNYPRSLADDPQAVERAAQTICDWRVALHHEPGEVSPYTGDRALAERVLRAAEGGTDT